MKLQQKQKTSVKHLVAIMTRFHFLWVKRIFLFLTSPLWIWLFILLNLILGKKLRDRMQELPRKNRHFNSLDYYNKNMLTKRAPQLLISASEWQIMNPQHQLIEVADGYFINTFLFHSYKKSNNWIIVLHGYGQNRYSILYLAKHFYEAGYNVLTYDARHHGENDSDRCTFGIKEAADLFYLLKFLQNHLTTTRKPLNFALVGNSMGASTILQALNNYPLPELGVKCAISDCGYSDFSEIIKVIGMKKLKIAWFWFYYGVSFFFIIKDKFRLNTIKPIKQLANCALTPVLFIHGLKDKTVPWTMSKQLYDEKIKSEKQINRASKLILFEGARHIEAIIHDYELYKNKTLDFVDYYLSK